MSLSAYLNSASYILQRELQQNTNMFTEKVCIITTDGRTLVGDLTAFDNNTNLVLSNTVERVIRPADDEEASSQVEHGLYLIRGDNVVIIGLVDEQLDESINWTKVRGEVIGGTKHV